MWLQIFCVLFLLCNGLCYSSDLNGKDTSLPKKPKIVIVCTSALIVDNYEMRQQEYAQALSRLREYGYEPYVFEARKLRSPSFLEEYSNHVFYSNVHNYQVRNKGINEATSMLAGINHYQFDDETMIIKTTGRYWLNSRLFLDIVENHPEMDAIVRFSGAYPPDSYVITGCFAMRCKYFKEMLEQLDLVKMEQQWISIECEVADYICKMEEQGCSVMRVDKIDMTANVGSHNPPIIAEW